MKRILNTLFLMFTTITMMGQNSFVVADKNGNSQFVQSLIFKQQQYGDRYSSGIRFLWKTDGAANGNIKDLLFIARSQKQLSTANSSEVTEMLETISGTEQADAEALAVTLDKNENVEESFPSDDGQSLFVQLKDDDVCSVYPMKQLYDPFEDETDDYSSYAKYNTQKIKKAAPYYRRTGSRGKVAVFNYFSNQHTRHTQNRMLEYMMQDLNDHDFGVEYYPYEDMTLDNLLSVYNSSKSYTAVVIISHGTTIENESYFVIGEEYDKSKCKESKYALLFGSGDVSSDKVPFNIRFWNEGIGAFSFKDKYNFLLRVKNFSLANEVILYMGSCDAYPNGNNKNGTCVGWSGTQSTAQAHATLLFYNLMRGKTLADALDQADKQFYYFDQVGTQLDTWTRDPITYANMECQFKSLYTITKDPDVSLPYLTPKKDYWRNGKCWLEEKTASASYGPIFLRDKEVKIVLSMYDDSNMNPDRTYPTNIYIKATPLRSDAASKIYSVKKKGGHEYKPVKISLSENGIYVITVAADENFANEILIDRPIVFVKAKPFKENGLDWDEEEFNGECPDDNHPHMIDLGLPSGTLWACCNVGANKPEDYGGYYSWGETAEKSIYSWDKYIHSDGSSDTYHDIGKDITGTQYDTAMASWGHQWLMPSESQMSELFENCTSEWTTINGVKGRMFTGPNGATLFLPAAGYHYDNLLYSDGDIGMYWSSTINRYHHYRANRLYFNETNNSISYDERANGLSVRPVKNGSEITEKEFFNVNGITFKMIGVEGGTFWMGSPDDDPYSGGIYSDEHPQHQVTIDSYKIGETEVTQKLWLAVMGYNPSEIIYLENPVENISWNDCQLFIQKLNSLTGRNFRLPTEAEWEFAARGGLKSKGYLYSGSDDPDVVSWNYNNSYYITQPVGLKQPNELGIYDMSGNVWEWCQDYYDYYYYEKSPSHNPCNNTKSSHHVHRGGSWEYIVTDLRVAMRGDYIKDENTRMHGLRIALSQ